MTRAVETLKGRRVRMILVNLVYFLALLALGVLLFLTGAVEGWVGYALVALCLAAYFLLVRPMREGYVRSVREEILRCGVGACLTDFRYQAKEGIPAERIRNSGLVSAGADTFLSRERLTGKSGAMAVEAADVTFPIVEEGRNAMFSGAFVEIHRPGANYRPVTVRAGALEGLNLPAGELALVKELGALIPGSLYLKAEGETLTLLLRGRFLGFPVNPLLPITEKTLESNPFPELEQAVALARRMEKT